MGVDFQGADIIFIDTAPFIYFFEKHDRYFHHMARFFDQVYETNCQVITSIITYIELTTQPARLGNDKLVRKYGDYLGNSENISTFPLDIKIADFAVQMRAKYQLKTPDAIQLGTALACGADYVLTNDRAWQQVTEVDLLLVDEL